MVCIREEVALQNKIDGFCFIHIRDVYLNEKLTSIEIEESNVKHVAQNIVLKEVTYCSCWANEILKWNLYQIHTCCEVEITLDITGGYLSTWIYHLYRHTNAIRLSSFIIHWVGCCREGEVALK